MLKRVIIRNGKKYMVNVPSWDSDVAWGDQVGTGSTPYILPFISVQPVNTTTGAGTSSFFTSAAGPAGPFDWVKYQWYSGSSAALVDGGRYTGSQSPNLTITPTIAANAGTYWVLASNAYGSITSSHVTLTVV
jgi:hypothetical protein